MSDGNLRLEASANFSRLEQAVERLQRKNATLEDKLRKVGQEQNNAGSKGVRAFDMMISRAASVAAGYVGIHQAISLVNQAIQEEISLYERAARVSQEALDNRLSFQFQTHELTELQRYTLKRQAFEVGNRNADLTENESLGLLRELFSATSGKPEQRIQEVNEMFDALTKVMGPTIRQFPELGSAALVLKRSLGEDATALDTTKFVSSALSQAMLAKPEDLPNLIRTIAAGVAMFPDVDKRAGVQLATEFTSMFAAFQQHVGDTVGANTSTAVVNFLASMRERTGRKDLTPLELAKLIDVNDPEFLKLIKGKGFSKPVQPELIRPGGEIQKTVLEIANSFNAAMKKPIDDLIAAQQGKFDPDISGARALKGAKARSDRFLEETRAQGKNAAEVVRESLVEIIPGFSNALQRGYINTALKYEPLIGVNQFEDSVSVMRSMMARAIAEQNLGPLGRFKQFRYPAQLLTQGMLTDEQLLAFPSGENTPLRRAQTEFRALIDLMNSREQEDRLRAQYEAKRRADDNSKLTDTVGKAVNSAVQGNRISSQEEN